MGQRYPSSLHSNPCLEHGAHDVFVQQACEVLETDIQLQLIRAGIGVGIILKRALPLRLSGTDLQTFAVADLALTLEAWLWHRRTGPVIAVTMPLIEHLVSRLLLAPTTVQRERHAHATSGT